MKPCERIQSLFPKLVEGEADPGDALRVARHLGDCTVCKIVLARERRLAEVLGTLEDTLPVDDAFIEKVMAAIPAGPPPANLGRARRRLIRLAGVGALAAALGAAAHGLLGAVGEAGIGPLRAGLDLEGGARLLEGVAAGVRSVLLMVAGSTASASAGGPGLPVAAVSPSALAVATCALLLAAAVFGVSAWTAAKPVFEAGSGSEPR